MKSKEILQPSDRILFEQIDRSNDTGFKTEDLVKIYRTEMNEDWQAASFEDCFAELDALDKLDGN